MRAYINKRSCLALFALELWECFLKVPHELKKPLRLLTWRLSSNIVVLPQLPQLLEVGLPPFFLHIRQI